MDFTKAIVRLKGVVLSPSRLDEYLRRTGEVVESFQTDVVQAGPLGTTVVTVQSEQPLFERIDGAQTFDADVEISVRTGTSAVGRPWTMVNVKAIAPANGKAAAPSPAAPASTPTRS